MIVSLRSVCCGAAFAAAKALTRMTTVSREFKPRPLASSEALTKVVPAGRHSRPAQLVQS